MPRYLKVKIICILFLVFSVPASSELYQYKDENGIMRITDNIYSVPVDSRSKLEQFSEFEDLSDEFVILPIQSKSLPPTENLTKTEKILYPKSPKEISAKTEKDIINPETAKKTASESKQETTTPLQPIVSEKSIQKPDTSESLPEPYKSRKITIKKKKPSQKAAQTKPKKSIKKKAETLATPKTIPESQIVEKDQTQKSTAKKTTPVSESKTEAKKVTPSKDSADAQKASTRPKTSQVKPEENIQKSTGPDTRKPIVSHKILTKTQKDVARLPGKSVKKAAQPDVKSKTVPEIKPETKIVKKQQTEKITAKKFTPDPDSKIKKTTPPKTVTADPKTAPDTKTAKKEPQKDIIKSAKPGTNKKTGSETKKQEARTPEKTPEIKSVQKTDTPTVAIKEIKTKSIIADTKTAASQKKPELLPKQSVKKDIQPDAKKKIAPETKIVKKEPAKKIAAKKVTQKLVSQTNPPKTTLSKDVAAGKKTAAPQKTVKAEPEIELPKNTPEIKKASTDNHDISLAKKDLTSLIIAHKTDLNKFAETEKSNVGNREITSKEPDLIKNSGQTEHASETVTTNKVIKNVTKELNEKDESLILAQLQTTRKLLAEKKEALNKKYLNLMEEKQELENSVDEDDEKSVLKYNENVKKLNIKIKHYKKMKKRLQAKIEEYNNTIKQSALN